MFNSMQIEIQRQISVLQSRFEANMHRHPNVDWRKIQAKLEANPTKLKSLIQMEQTGGEPDVIELNAKSDEFIFVDCSPESPKGRRSCCYDQAARQSRKENQPKSSAEEMAGQMGVRLLTEDLYRRLQQTGELDTKTSSWLATPASIRKLGGAIFADRRYDNVFIYHNGADSYYASRGFRASIVV